MWFCAAAEQQHLHVDNIGTARETLRCPLLCTNGTKSFHQSGLLACNNTANLIPNQRETIPPSGPFLHTEAFTFRDLRLKSTTHNKRLFVILTGQWGYSARVTFQHDVTFPGHQHAHMKMSKKKKKKINFVFGVISSWKSHSGKNGRVWQGVDTALYRALQRQIFWSGGCKNSVQPMSPEIAGFFDTGKYYNWESGYKVSFLFMTWFNIHLRNSEQLGWKSRTEV